MAGAFARDRRGDVDGARSGFCVASWQPEVVALAAPVQIADAIYSLNVSVSSGETIREVVDGLGKPILKLRQEILSAIAARNDA